MTLDDDLDDLLGTSKPSKREPIEYSTKTTDVHRIVGGVSVPWIMRVFRMGRSKVEGLLADCRPLGTHPNGGLYYDLAEAAAYLVKPTRDMKAILKTITAKDLPDELREAFWSAKLKEQKFRVLAGELWPTPAVLEVFGEAFKSIKSAVQLWSDTVEESEGLTDAQRELIMTLSDKLLADIRKKLVEQARSNATESQLAELSDET